MSLSPGWSGLEPLCNVQHKNSDILSQISWSNEVVKYWSSQVDIPVPVRKIEMHKLLAIWASLDRIEV
jgi:hypothetical protein